MSGRRTSWLVAAVALGTVAWWQFRGREPHPAGLTQPSAEQPHALVEERGSAREQNTEPPHPSRGAPRSTAASAAQVPTASTPPATIAAAPAAGQTALPRPQPAHTSRPDPAADAESVAPLARYELDGPGIRAAVQSVLPDVRECYDGWLKVGAPFRGKLRVRLVIEEDPKDPSHGIVTSAHIEESDLEHAALEGCLLNALSEPDFEPPEEGGKVEITYPFAFAPEAADEGRDPP